MTNILNFPAFYSNQGRDLSYSDERNAWDNYIKWEDQLLELRQKIKKNGAMNFSDSIHNHVKIFKIYAQSIDFDKYPYLRYSYTFKAITHHIHYLSRMKQRHYSLTWAPIRALKEAASAIYNRYVFGLWMTSATIGIELCKPFRAAVKLHNRRKLKEMRDLKKMGECPATYVAFPLNSNKPNRSKTITNIHTVYRRGFF